MRTLAMPRAVEPWSLTSLREKLIKIGAKVVSHGRYVTFQIAEVAVPRQMFQEILMLIGRLRASPAAPTWRGRGGRTRAMTTGEVCLDAHKATRFSAYARSPGWFNPLLRMREAIYPCPRRSTGRSCPHNVPESGECRSPHSPDKAAILSAFATILG
jgi:hypothetical protein